MLKKFLHWWSWGKPRPRLWFAGGTFWIWDGEKLWEGRIGTRTYIERTDLTPRKLLKLGAMEMYDWQAENYLVLLREHQQGDVP